MRPKAQIYLQSSVDCSYVPRRSHWFLEWTIWLQLLWWLTDNMVPKECQGQALSVLGHPHVAGHSGPFLPRTLLCGCISFSGSLLTGPFLFLFLLLSVPSSLDAIWGYTHTLPSRSLCDSVCISCTRACVCVCSQHSYISFCLFFHHMVNVDYTFVCIKENACENLPVLAC